MKNIVIIIGTTLLGAYIFHLMTGDGQDSLLGAISYTLKETVLANGG